MNKKFFAALALAALTALSACGGDKDEAKKDMPDNIISYDDKDSSELIPVDGVEIGGTEASASEDDLRLPTDEELGEYQEIFLEGDIIDEASLGGWVISVSLTDITVNTYNELTTYILEGSAKAAANHVKPGDAVLINHYENEDGQQVAYEIGRVRMEDEPLTKDVIAEMYRQATEGEDNE